MDEFKLNVPQPVNIAVCSVMFGAGKFGGKIGIAASKFGFAFLTVFIQKQKKKRFANLTED